VRVFAVYLKTENNIPAIAEIFLFYNTLLQIYILSVYIKILQIHLVVASAVMEAIMFNSSELPKARSHRRVILFLDQQIVIKLTMENTAKTCNVMSM
jgi:hypothetical protein